MKLDGKRVLVTGAGGFIGSHLVEALVDRGLQVSAMVHYDARPTLSNLEHCAPGVRDKIEILSGNIEDPFFVARAVEGHDVVFHLAALIAIPYSYVAPASYVRTNIEGTLNVLEACRLHKVEKLVHTSTSETYGTARYRPINEEHPLQGQSPYSATKIGADKLAESYYLSFDLPVATIRPFNTFGPRQSARAVIPTIISQALTQREVRLGSLDPLRDLTYVADTAAGFIAVAESDATIGGVTNCGNGEAISIGELAHKILSLLGMDKPIVSDAERIRPEKSEVMALICDRQRAKAIAGWEPKVPLEEGLRRTITFVEKNLDSFRPTHYNR